MEQITVEQALSYTRAGDRVQIIDEDYGIEIFTGYASLLPEEKRQELADRKVRQYHYTLDIKHKEWKERGLMPPIEPDQLAQYSFSDLQVSVYTQIYI